MSADEAVNMSVPGAGATEGALGARWLAAARLAWIAIVLLMLGLTAGGFVASLRNWELIGSRSIYLAITSAGVPVTLVTVLGLLLPHVVYVTTGIFIFLRRSRDWRAMFFALALMSVTSFRPLLAAERAAPALSLAVDAALAIGIFSNITLLFIFPNGRFVPLWTRYLMLGAIPVSAMLSRPMRVVMMLPDRPSVGAAGSVTITVVAMGAFLVVGFTSQVYRFRMASDTVERQQIKLVSFTISLFMSVLLLGFAVPALFINTDNAWFAWGMLATVPIILAIPVSVAVAILRYQLFAINHIISRTLAYGALTIVLAAVYSSSVMLLGPLVGGSSNVSVAGASLAVAALFRPARRHIQQLVDRRFNRRKYDVRRTVEEFGHDLQDELDVTEIERELLSVVQETLQPQKMALWSARALSQDLR